MAKVVTIYEAKANLSKLVKQARDGSTIYIGAFGVPQAMLMPLPKRPKVKLGVWQGKQQPTYADNDLIESDPELLGNMIDSSLFPNNDH